MFVDAEDYGDTSGFDQKEDTWCLGTQYWINHGMKPYSSDDLPVYGILLDMVGGRNARFHYELFFARKRNQTDYQGMERGRTPGT